MKKVQILATVVLALGFLSFSILPQQTRTKKAVTAPSKIEWITEAISLGQIPQGKPKTINFEFKNKGSKAVVITNVQASCGCTATNYTKTKIDTGKSGKITVTYDAAAKGDFTKTVTVTTTASTTPTILMFKGKVK